MSLLRLPLIVLSTTGIHSALTPPNPSVSRDEQQKYSTFDSKIGTLILWWPWLLKMGVVAAGVCESAVIVASNYPLGPLGDHILSTLVVKPGSISSISVTNPFLAGVFITTLSSYIRYRCYRTLGKFFTYQLSIRKDHQLVTSGPYSVVRHPSYTCMIMAFVGMGMTLLSPGSWLRESGVLDTSVGRVSVSAMVGMGLGLSSLAIYRTPYEDRALRAEFGQQWDQWAQAVPYRLIPYVY